MRELSKLKSGQDPIWMTQKPKGKVKVFKIQKNFKGVHDLASPLETCAFGAHVRNRSVFILDQRLLVLSETKLMKQSFYIKKEFFKTKIIQMGRKNLMDYHLYKPYLVRQLLKRISQFFLLWKGVEQQWQKRELYQRNFTLLSTKINN